MNLRSFLFLIVLLNPMNVYAVNAWYEGTVTNLQTLGPDGSFIVRIDNQTIKDDCLHSRISFRVQDMGYERTKIAFSMALAAFASGKTYGVVVNITTANEICYASATASQGAGIRN